MYLIYFDENKFSEEYPFFYLGGILLNSEKIADFERVISQIQYNFFGSNLLKHENELHGKELFHGKGNCKTRKAAERIAVFEQVSDFLSESKIPMIVISIDVHAHRKKYRYPQPEYQLGLMLLLERVSEFLDKRDTHGVIFGDYEKDEVARSIRDFSEYKIAGSTPMYGGRPLGRLIDTIYYTQSHHSRFLQVADLLTFMAQRYCKVTEEPEKWMDKKLYTCWKKLEEACLSMKNWP